MKHIRAKNVNEALREGFIHLNIEGIIEQSRNGPVIVSPGPVMTTYERPEQRVLFNPIRDANPVFHLLEAIWMLAGSANANWLLPYNKNFAQYAEHDMIVHGAYGWRWRVHSGLDQIKAVVDILRKDPESRRAVIQMWDSRIDLGAAKKDVPCNTGIYFDLRHGFLNMTVTNRSNDILWGAYGANAVHMSMLQELIALAVGAPIGVYRQFSNNFHAYTENDQVKRFLTSPPEVVDYYAFGDVQQHPLLVGSEQYEDFLADCWAMVHDRAPFKTVFMSQIAQPLKERWDYRKAGSKISMPQSGNDWHVAFTEWVERRETKQGEDT